MQNDTDETIIEKHAPQVRERARRELNITRELLRTLHAADFALEIDDGGSLHTGTEDELIAAAFSVDEFTINTTNTHTGKTSHVLCIHGNDYDLISDYGTSLCDVIDPLLDWIGEQQDQGLQCEPRKGEIIAAEGRPELSFDGMGINGPDQHRTRIATFDRKRWSDEEIKRYGYLFAAAPQLLAALDNLQANPNDPRAHRAAFDAMKLARKTK